MKKKILYGFLIAAALLLIFAVKTFHKAGEFKDLKPHSNYKCTVIKGIPGGEDIEVDRSEGIAFISSDDRRGGRGGAIYRYDFKSGGSGLKKISGNLPFEFHPHGISIYPKKGRAELLFAVNHRKGFDAASAGHFVEIFEISDKGLKHRRSVSGRLLTSPNDVAAVGGERFYATNDHGSAAGLMRVLEDYLQLPLSYIVYFDGSSFRKVADGLSYGNGISLSRDKKTVYAASTLSGDINVYSRNSETGDLKLIREIDLGTGVDNIDIDPEGNLWVGCHPKLLTFVKYSKNPRVKSPSQVIRIKAGAEASYTSEEVYLNSGDELSGSSVGAPFLNRLLIGSVFDNHILDCGEKK